MFRKFQLENEHFEEPEQRTVALFVLAQSTL
jgi:hypothetical protein